MEALRAEGEMTKRQLLLHLDWPKGWIETNPPLLALLVEEGLIERIHRGKFMYYRADPDITQQLLTPKEHDDSSGRGEAEDRPAEDQR